MIDLWTGDCLELMKKIPNESIDLILTDPPFNVNIDYGNEFDDNIDDSEYSKWLGLRFIEMERILKPGKCAIIFSGDKKIHSMFDAISNTKLIFHHFLKWNKPHSQRTLSGFVLFCRTELAFLLSKGKPDQKILNRKIVYSDTLIHENTTPKGKDDISPVDHPCRRPVDLYFQIICGFTNENDMVLDSFVGSGTTLLACKMSQRNGIGMEINPKYETIIKERIMINRPSLFTYT